MDVYALDRFQQIGRIMTATRVQVVERDLAEGGWLLEMPLGAAGDIGAAMLAATWPGIEIVDPDTGWRFGGYLTEHAIVVDDDGTELLRFTGKDFQSDLGGWLEWPNSGDAAQWWVVTYGGTIPLTRDAHNTVYFSAGPGAPAGRPRIDGLTFGFNPDEGAPKSRRLKGETLLDVMRFLFADSLDYTARLRFMRSETGAGFVQFDTPDRQLSTLVLNVKRGTFGRVEVTTSAAKATWVLGMGAEVEPVVTPGERLIATISSTETNWRYRHRETAINRPATDSFDALADEVNAVLLDPDSWYRRAVKVDSARVDGWGRDIDLGWLVDVQLGPTFTPSTVRLPVVASTLTFTPEASWVRTVDVGTETLSGPAALFASIARTRAALRQVEADLR